MSNIDRLVQHCPGKRALITGAGSGLGRAFALDLARRGWSIALLDLSEERLESVAREVEGAGGRAFHTALDVVSDGLEQAFIDFAETEGGLDLCINNAGVAVAGPFAQISDSDWRWQTEINLMAVVRGCRQAARLMSGRGIIINIASAASFACAPQMSPYNVTKAGVVALSETLAVELADQGISVAVAMPTFFQTRLTETMRGSAEARDFAAKLMRRSAYTAKRAAADILSAAARGDLYIPVPNSARWLWRFKRLAPTLFRRRLAGFARGERGKPGRKQKA